MLAQVSLEFIVFVSVLIVILLLTIYYNSSYYTQINSEKIINNAQIISDQISSEINLALKAGDGYYRTFRIPAKISDSFDYSIAVDNYLVELTWSAMTTTSTILTENITGDVVKGQNSIKNLDGIVYVNQ